MKTNIMNCQRCAGGHINMKFAKLDSPADEWTHWGICENTKQPVLLKITSDADTKSNRMEKTIHVGQGTKLIVIETKDLPAGDIIIEGARPI